MECKYCGSKEVGEYLKVITSEKMKELHTKDPRFPAYSFHWGQRCLSCGKWLGWKKHDDDLLNKEFHL